jgi:hypothetical protein
MRLHGAPESSYKLTQKEIIVNSSGEMIVITESGNPEPAMCGKKAYKQQK